MKDLTDTHQQKKFKILLIGDSCIDEYYYGTCERLNPEAPVPILKITNWSVKQGMAANVKNNLEANSSPAKAVLAGITSGTP